MTDSAAESAAKDATAAVAAAPAAPPAKSEALEPAGDEVAVAAAPAVGEKRARTALSLHEKAVVKSFCEQKVSESKARGELVPSQDQLRREIASKFGWTCGRSTLSKIVSMDWKLLQQGALQNPNMKRQRRPLFPAFEADLVKFIAAYIDAAGGIERSLAADVDAMLPDQSSEPGEGATTSVDAGCASTDRLRGSKAVLTEALILEEAQRLKQVHNIKDEQLVLSVGWLARFKHRHGIRLRKTPAGSRGGDARARDVAENRAAMPPGTSTSIPGGVEGVNWSNVDPLLLTSSSSMLDALHVVDNEAMAVGKGPTDAQTTAMSNASSLERQKSDDIGAQPSVDAIQDDLMELLASIASPSALCGLLSSSDPASDESDSLWELILDKLPTEIRRLSCRCGGSQLRALSREGVKGLRVVVVGANSTVDAFIVAALVGDRGHVTCIESVQASRELGAKLADQYVRDILQYPAATDPVLQFISPDSFSPELDSHRAAADIVLVNCSLQTAEPSRVQQALACLTALMKPGGELRFTTVCSSRRFSSDETAGISPSLDAAKEQLLRLPYYVDLCLLCQKLERRVDLRTITSPIDPAFTAPLLGDTQTKFYRCVLCLFAVEDLETSHEDYGQVATYTGHQGDGTNALPSFESAYRLDDEFCFVRGERVPVDGNTARVLQSSWLRGVIAVEGDQSCHRGGFQRAGCLNALHHRPNTPKVDAKAHIETESRMTVADI